VHATLCDYLADIAQNAIEAGASLVEVDVDEDGENVKVRVGDNGKGMDAATQARLWDPFYSEEGKHDHRRVGLGLPLLRQVVEATGGGFKLDSLPGKGTTVSFSLPAAHLDTPPLGDLPGTFLSLMAHDGTYDLQVRRTRGTQGYAASRAELLDALGELQTVGSLVLARDYLRGLETELTNMNNEEPRNAVSGGHGEG